MPRVRLSGQLVCSDDAQLALVEAHLPAHVALTRAEPGCESFEVLQSADSLVWQVDELFADEDAFARHQARVAGSAWGHETAGIERRYEVVLEN